MPTGPKGQKRPADVIGNAVRVMRIAIGEEEDDVRATKVSVASKGGKARAAKLPPFPDARARWLGPEPKDGQRHAAVSLYLALMTATCLDLSGAEGCIVVEGPFAANMPYLSMLSAATGRPVIRQQAQGTGASIGAALLAGVHEAVSEGVSAKPYADEAALRQYAHRWRGLAAGIAV